MLCGAALGWVVRNKSLPRHQISRGVSVVICILMAMIGIEIGSSESVLAILGTILSDALLLTFGALAGTIILAWAVNRWVVKATVSENDSEQVSNTHTFSYLIVGVFIMGALAGYYRVIPSQAVEYSMWVLYLLMALVGFSIGSDANTLRALGRQPWQVVFVPITTIVGTLIGVVAISPLVGLNIWDQLAVGSGFGYYSLSSVLLSELRNAEIGAIALIVNVMRELVTVIAAPYLVRIFSPVALICSGGATTIDVTLPVIVNNCGGTFVGMAIFHGVVVDMSVPLLVSLFSSFS